MRRALACAPLCACVAFLSISVNAGERDPKAVAQVAIARSSDNRGVWTITDTNKLKHIQSGMECTATDANALQFQRLVTPRTGRPQGDETSCTYEDADRRNRMEVHALRAEARETLDSAFSKAKIRFLRDFARGAQPTSAATIPGLKIPNPALHRAETFMKVCPDGRGGLGVCHAKLMVSLVDGWIVDVSTSFSLAPPQNMGLGQIMEAMQSMSAWQTAVQSISSNRPPWDEALISPPEPAADSQAQ